jgi:hypothetical protein
MRVIVASLILALAAPAFAGKDPAACKTHCDSNYQFCMSRALTKAAKKACKTSHKNCKTACK